MTAAGDNLDRIEARVEEFHATTWQPGRVPYWVAAALADDVLALVEVAKAAQEAKKLLGTGYHNDTFDDQAYRVLAAALARLEDNQ